MSGGVNGFANHNGGEYLVACKSGNGPTCAPPLSNTPVYIVPSKDGGTAGRVTALDAAYVLQAASENRQLSPVERIACDVTGNGSISAVDANRILEFRVGLIDQLPVAAACGSDWVFFPRAAFGGRFPVIEGGTCQLGEYLLGNYFHNGTTEGLDFGALAFGDCAPAKDAPP